jgi:hypothetical protein
VTLDKEPEPAWGEIAVTPHTECEHRPQGAFRTGGISGAGAARTSDCDRFREGNQFSFVGLATLGSPKKATR